MARRPLDALNNEIDPSDPANRGMDTPEMPPQDENPVAGGPAGWGTPSDVGQTGGVIQPPNPVGGDLGPPVGLDGQPTTGGGVTPTTGGGIDAHPSPATPTANDSLRTALTSKLQGLIGRTAPNIDAAIGAHRTASQRTAERERALLAERAAAEGYGNSGGLDSGILGIDQARGESDANYEADLTQRGQDQNDAMVLQALGLGGNYLQGQDRLNLDEATNEGQMNLQALLALLNALGQQGAGV